jgi:hypothetical protein
VVLCAIADQPPPENGRYAGSAAWWETQTSSIHSTVSRRRPKPRRSRLYRSTRRSASGGVRVRGNASASGSAGPACRSADGMTLRQNQPGVSLLRVGTTVMTETISSLLPVRLACSSGATQSGNRRSSVGPDPRTCHSSSCNRSGRSRPPVRPTATTLSSSATQTFSGTVDPPPSPSPKVQ